MNRLILIGNGFDLAHGMKTSYNDFILWYLKKCFKEALENKLYSDQLIKITVNERELDKQVLTSIIEDYVHKNLQGLFHDDKLYFGLNFIYNPFKIEMQSKLFEVLVDKCRVYNWVDIENEFYQNLKDILWMTESSIISGYPDRKKDRLKNLNDSLKSIISHLKDYLSIITNYPMIEDYDHIFNSEICKAEIVIDNNLKNDFENPESTLLLNFNYTNTAKQYLTCKLKDENINYIHGKVDNIANPLIFGFGDELDSDYSKIELQKLNEYFEYIKSFWYFKTSNYHNLVRFIEGDEFQVYILGHSCGLSDRTMLNMIFEHENCKSIKIFYHGTKEKNNFTNLTQEISRHFKDKGMMRKKIVPFDKSEPMPQVE